MIPQVLSLIQRTFTGPARARAMRAVRRGAGGRGGRRPGGRRRCWSARTCAAAPGGRSSCVNVPIGAGAAARGRAAPATRDAASRAAAWTRPGWPLLTPAVLALVLPLVLGQSEHWPAWGWAVPGRQRAVLRRVRRWWSGGWRRAGGSPLMPGRVLRLPGVATGIAALFAVMAVFGGFFFALALHLQGGLGESALRAGLTFAPAGLAFAAGQPELAAAARAAASGADRRRLRGRRGRPARAGVRCCAAAGTAAPGSTWRRR